MFVCISKKAALFLNYFTLSKLRDERGLILMMVAPTLK
jgi:hypothetical protein